MDGNFDAVMGFMGCIIGINETYNQYERTINSSATSSIEQFNKEIDKLLVNNPRLFMTNISPV